MCVTSASTACPLTRGVKEMRLNTGARKAVCEIEQTHPKEGKARRVESSRVKLLLCSECAIVADVTSSTFRRGRVGPDVCSFVDEMPHLDTDEYFFRTRRQDLVGSF